MPSGRIDFFLNDVFIANDEQSFVADVLTNGVAPPQATLIGRDGYPAVTEFYADPRKVRFGSNYFNVIRFRIFFASRIPDDAKTIAVSFFQEDATTFKFPWHLDIVPVEEAIAGPDYRNVTTAD